MLLLEIHLPIPLRPLSKAKLHLFFVLGNKAYVNFVKKMLLWNQFKVTIFFDKSNHTQPFGNYLDFLLAKVGLVRKHDLGLKPH
jgi:hypothetical protein